MNLANDAAITDKLLKRTMALNDMPTRKKDAYGKGLLAAYKKFLQESG